MLRCKAIANTGRHVAASGKVLDHLKVTILGSAHPTSAVHEQDAGQSLRIRGPRQMQSELPFARLAVDDILTHVDLWLLGGDTRGQRETDRLQGQREE